jgi:hypothetical protein
VIPIVLVLREPAAWKKAKAEAAQGAAHKNIGSPAELFRIPRWRRNTIVGLCLGVAGMVGLWSIGFFSPELITTALKNTPLKVENLNATNQLGLALFKATNPAALHIRYKLSVPIQAQLEAWSGTNTISPEMQQTLLAEMNRLIQGENLYDPAAFKSVILKKTTLNLLQQVQQKAQPADRAFLNRQLLEQTFPGTVASIQGHIDWVRSAALALQDVGAFLGMLCFTFFASYQNRRRAFFGAFVLCLMVTAFVFYSLKTETDAYWMLPMMGFAQLSVFAGYSIYFPELFPTRLRGTGVGFCYNTVRYLTVPFNLLSGYLATQLSFRTGAIIMSSIYLVGAVALIWAPETKDQPLPED